MVGVAQLVERRIVVPDAVGSSPISHPIFFPSLRRKLPQRGSLDGGMWCNGNTRDFDSRIVGSSPAVPANFYAPVAQAAEHLPFKQGVGGSNPPWSTKNPTEFFRRVFSLAACQAVPHQFTISISPDMEYFTHLAILTA